ncbi:MAG TPA: SDR family oxidoreductase [Polyangiaceae bacterium]|nr:SDR family oxidoreductase [Polyangiaceae bacterium]
MRDYFSEQRPPEEVLAACPIVKSLRGQKALVTGANSGIGKSIALALGHAGADVVVNYVSREEEAQRVVAEIQRCGARAYAHRADVSSEAEVERMFGTMIAELGTVDIVVNNAGLQKDAPFHELTVADWDLVMNVNLKGQFLCSRAAVREFRRRGVVRSVSCSAGKIICISSVHDVIPWAGHVNYATSKGGISMMMKSIAQEVAPLGIRVNAISPGAVRTPINMDAWGTRDAYNALMALIPCKRIGEPLEIGRAAVWLASDDSDYITGTTIYVDGGMTLYPGFETGG